jgi:hypothetical protein
MGIPTTTRLSSQIDVQRLICGYFLLSMAKRANSSRRNKAGADSVSTNSASFFHFDKLLVVHGKTDELGVDLTLTNINQAEKKKRC